MVGPLRYLGNERYSYIAFAEFISDAIEIEMKPKKWGLVQSACVVYNIGELAKIPSSSKGI